MVKLLLKDTKYFCLLNIFIIKILNVKELNNCIFFINCFKYYKYLYFLYFKTNLLLLIFPKRFVLYILRLYVSKDFIESGMIN